MSVRPEQQLPNELRQGRGGPTYAQLLEIVRKQKELREKIEKRDANVVDFPGNGAKKH